MSISQKQMEFRRPLATDGVDVSSLIKACPPLDTNSMYCNLLQCTHFSSTSIAAIHNHNIVGFISGYIIPDRPDTLFIWQVAVDESARGHGLASRMIKEILSRPSCSKLSYIETTITKSNIASWNLFESLANKLNTKIKKSTMFDRDRHFSGNHDTELLARIGPISLTQTPKTNRNNEEL
ncbi:MAG: diaminobutyrate acetyltransferase [Gammaproteobacteria bacterium]|nr:diaminobutyrate acetyltransferase [Gammaproteobacteria bacterium]